MVPEPPLLPFFFFFNDTATTEIYTLSLHDALPISTLALTTPAIMMECVMPSARTSGCRRKYPNPSRMSAYTASERSEEHTSELQSQSNLVCRLLLEKKKDCVLSEAAPRHASLGHFA